MVGSPSYQGEIKTMASMRLQYQKQTDSPEGYCMRRKKLNIGIFGSKETTAEDIDAALAPYLVRSVVIQYGISPTSAVQDWADYIPGVQVSNPEYVVAIDEVVPQIAQWRAKVHSILEHSDLVLIEVRWIQAKPDLFDIILRSGARIATYRRHKAQRTHPGQTNLLGQTVRCEPQSV